MTRFIVVPQWQGSSSSRAMQLVDGAGAIAGDLPRARSTVVEVPLEAGESLDSGIRRFSALHQTSGLQLDALTSVGVSDGPVVTIGGDAGVATTSALWTAGATRGAVDPGVVVLWLSAHAGLHDPESSPTGAFDTMAARAVVDATVPRVADALPHSALLSAGRLILAGVRLTDDAEQDAAERLGVRIVSADELTPAALAAAVRDAGASGVFVHVDLDVLDPSALSGLSDPVPFGVDVATLTASIAAVRAVAPLVGGAITEFSPASPDAAVDDLGAILRIIGALA
ncbi:arginase family protein [Microbacterium sp. P01]|uniref:arginase family protein n=1 Tax=unclassified Microbacterium TaxID=2609290 RepID=UPI0036715E28